MAEGQGHDEEKQPKNMLTTDEKQYKSPRQRMRERRSQLAMDQAAMMNPVAMRFDNDLHDIPKNEKSNLLGKAYNDFGADDSSEQEPDAVED